MVTKVITATTTRNVLKVAAMPKDKIYPARLLITIEEVYSCLAKPYARVQKNP